MGHGQPCGHFRARHRERACLPSLPHRRFHLLCTLPHSHPIAHPIAYPIAHPIAHRIAHPIEALEFSSSRSAPSPHPLCSLAPPCFMILLILTPVPSIDEPPRDAPPQLGATPSMVAAIAAAAGLVLLTVQRSKVGLMLGRQSSLPWRTTTARARTKSAWVEARCLVASRCRATRWCIGGLR